MDFTMLRFQNEKCDDFSKSISIKYWCILGISVRLDFFLLVCSVRQANVLRILVTLSLLVMVLLYCNKYNKIEIYRVHMFFFSLIPAAWYNRKLLTAWLHVWSNHVDVEQDSILVADIKKKVDRPILCSHAKNCRSSFNCLPSFRL